MDIDLDNLPDDTARLRGMLREVVTTTNGQIKDLLAENDKLRLLIQRLSRHQFGGRSEQLSPDQLQIELGMADPAGAGNQAEAGTAKPANDDPKPPPPPPPTRHPRAVPPPTCRATRW